MKILTRRRWLAAAASVMVAGRGADHRAHLAGPRPPRRPGYRPGRQPRQPAARRVQHPLTRPVQPDRPAPGLDPRRRGPSDPGQRARRARPPQSLTSNQHSTPRPNVKRTRAALPPSTVIPIRDVVEAASPAAGTPSRTAGILRGSPGQQRSPTVVTSEPYVRTERRLRAWLAHRKGGLHYTDFPFWRFKRALCLPGESSLQASPAMLNNSTR
jgi:hypothetical protein